MATTTKTFCFEELEALVENYYDESDAEHDARIALTNEIITITLFSKDTNRVQVFRVLESQRLYEQMESAYMKILKTSSSGSDFWDKWAAVMQVLQNHQIVDESFQF